MAAKIPPILKQAEQGEIGLVVPSVVVAESVYVLEGLGFTRDQVAFALRAFYSLQGVILEESNVILTALSDYERTNVDFQDAYLAAKCKLSDGSVLTWNTKDFDKLGCSYERP
jgi:predicted nucleic-acid-binding protein